MGSGGFFPTNPDLVDILGRTDFDFYGYYFLDLLDPKFPDFQVSRFPAIGLGPWAGLGPLATTAGMLISRKHGLATEPLFSISTQLETIFKSGLEV